MVSNVINDLYLEGIKESCEVFTGEIARTPIDTDAIHKEKLTEYFEALTREEMELFIDIVPVDLCMRRIQKELDKASEFEKAIKLVVNGVR